MSEPYTLQPEDAVARWSELAPLLERLPSTTATPLSHIRDMVEKLEAQVWCIGHPVECLLITKIENTFETRYGLMWVAAGDHRVKDILKPIVENWFRAMGCTHSCVIGRRGWKKQLPDYTEESVTLVKPL